MIKPTDGAGEKIMRGMIQQQIALAGRGMNIKVEAGYGIPESFITGSG